MNRVPAARALRPKPPADDRSNRVAWSFARRRTRPRSRARARPAARTGRRATSRPARSRRGGAREAVKPGTRHEKDAPTPESRAGRRRRTTPCPSRDSRRTPWSPTRGGTRPATRTSRCRARSPARVARRRRSPARGDSVEAGRAAATTWIIRGRRVASPPRPRRGYSVGGGSISAEAGEISTPPRRRSRLRDRAADALERTAHVLAVGLEDGSQDVVVDEMVEAARRVADRGDVAADVRRRRRRKRQRPRLRRRRGPHDVDRARGRRRARRGP